LRKLKILVATLAMTLLFAAPAFAAVLGDTTVVVGPEPNEVLLDLEFSSETEIIAGPLDFGTNSTD